MRNSAPHPRDSHFAIQDSFFYKTGFMLIRLRAAEGKLHIPHAAFRIELKRFP